MSASNVSEGLREALRDVMSVNHSPFLGSDGIRECQCAIHENARAALAHAAPERLYDDLDRDAPLSLRRKAAADLSRDTADRLAALGFGCEIIATWESAGGERTAAHVTTANPSQPDATEEAGR